MPAGRYSALELRQLVAAQLGRIPTISFEVAVQCSYGWPAVLKNLPIKPSGEPNPNLYYLCCPWLRRRLARLEDAGLIVELQRLAAADAELEADTRRAQDEYAGELRAAMNTCRAPGLPAGRDLIAGARGPLLLKCLHAHLAYYLVHSDYRLGEILAGKVGEIWCPDERCSGMMVEIRGASRSGAAGAEEEMS